MEEKKQKIIEEKVNKVMKKRRGRGCNKKNTKDKRGRKKKTRGNTEEVHL